MFLWIIATLVGAYFIYQKIVKPHSYWTERDVKQNKQMFLFGDCSGMSKTQSFADVITKLYNDFPKEKVTGIYQFLTPMLMIRDPELIKQVTVKDFDHFTDHRPLLPDGDHEFWSKNLFALNGQKWKNMRAVLSPSFTSSKMKMMFTLMSECAEKYISNMMNDCDKIKEREMKDLFAKYANDVIATTAFGFSIDSYDGNNEFYKMGKEITNFEGLWMTIKFLLIMLVPRLSQMFGIKLFSKRAHQFFLNVVKEVVKVREEQNIVRPDMINLLMEARKGRELQDEQDEQIEEDIGFATVDITSNITKTIVKKEKITDKDMTAQAMVFFFAGFDGVSSMMSFLAYELAVNPDCQDKLRQEIDKVRENGPVMSYETLAKMKYMDMVVSEAFRLWPNVVAIDRKCTKKYTVKLDGKTLVIPEGGFLNIPVFGLHRDPQYYPNPNQFDPERFSDENKHNINPYTYLPFGIGPRNCIGNRFALLEIKIFFFYLLSKMELVPNNKTPIPMKLSTKAPLLADPGFYLDVIPRKNN